MVLSVFRVSICSQRSSFLIMTFMWSYLSENEEATETLGRTLAGLLVPVTVVALVGSLGAGKTRFVQVIATSLDVPRRMISSPTFVLINEYSGRLPIYHFDSYRLQDPREFLDLGIEEYFEGQGICLIEWADRVREYLPEIRVEIHIDILSMTARRFTCSARGEEPEIILDKLRFEMEQHRVSEPTDREGHPLE